MTDDGVKMIAIDGPNGKDEFKVWTKRVGSGPIKMLLLHGGPGLSCEYFECFEDFLPQHGVEVIYYNQLGSHLSDQPSDPSLWTVARFLEEVEQVRQALGLEDFYLYGHSWGAQLGIEYGLKYGQHLKGLILSSMTASIQAWQAYGNSLQAQMSPEAIAVIEQYQALGDVENSAYITARQEFDHRHVCRVVPWPEPVTRTDSHLAKPVSNALNATGFEDWDRWADLHNITVPTLLAVGRHDMMNPAEIEKMGTLIPNSSVLICENGSHLVFWDDQAAYFSGLVQFLNDVEAGRDVRSS